VQLCPSWLNLVGSGNSGLVEIEEVGRMKGYNLGGLVTVCYSYPEPEGDGMCKMVEVVVWAVRAAKIAWRLV
jgi:hypothetical protein